MKNLIMTLTFLISSVSMASMQVIGSAESDAYLVNKSEVEKIERRGHCTQGPFGQRCRTIGVELDVTSSDQASLLAGKLRYDINHSVRFEEFPVISVGIQGLKRFHNQNETFEQKENILFILQNASHRCYLTYRVVPSLKGKLDDFQGTLHATRGLQPIKTVGESSGAAALEEGSCTKSYTIHDKEVIELIQKSGIFKEEVLTRLQEQ